MNNNRETDPHKRVMEEIGDFFNPECQEVHMCSMGTDGREACIQFQSKGKCIRACNRSHTTLRGQVISDYTHYINNCREDFEMVAHTQKRKSGGGGVWNSYLG